MHEGTLLGSERMLRANDRYSASPELNLDVVAWAEVLVNYARDWDDTFSHRESYFTQDYWYLFVGCLLHYWRGRPLTVSEACQIMKTGSNRTREARIKRAVQDGYLAKQRADEDRRSSILMPTPHLETILRGHFERTLERMRSLLK